jgi:hypothetical protein
MATRPISFIYFLSFTNHAQYSPPFIAGLCIPTRGDADEHMKRLVLGYRVIIMLEVHRKISAIMAIAGAYVRGRN